MLKFVIGSFLVLLFSTQLGAQEQEFFTWVDAQGRIHNSPVNHKKDTKNTPKQSPDKSESDNKKETSNDEYLSEEEFKAKQEKKRQESPAFFTWVDANGQVYNQWIPASSKAINKEATDSREVYLDDVFVKPLRLENTDKIDCCAQYGSYFSKPLKSNLSYHFTNIKAKPYFVFADESAPAFYFSFQGTKAASRKLDIIQIHSALKPSIIALDENFKPLYQSHALKGVMQPQNWYQTEQTHFALQFDDADIEYLIWYYPDFNRDKKSLEKLELLLLWQAQSSK